MAELLEARIFFRNRFLTRRFGIEGDGGMLDIVAIDRGDGGNIGPGKGAQQGVGHGESVSSKSGNGFAVRKHGKTRAKEKDRSLVSCGPICRPTKFLDRWIKEAVDYSRLPNRRSSIMNRLMKSR
jgi:hypothetical protein